MHNSYINGIHCSHSCSDVIAKALHGRDQCWDTLAIGPCMPESYIPGVSVLCLPPKDTGTLLDRPWPHQSDIKGKAVSLICSSMLLAQITDALFVGALIDMFGSSSVMLVVIFAACGLGAVAAMFVRTSRQASLSV